MVTASDRLEILQQIAESEPVALRRLNPSVPIDLATIVAKSISKEASSRYETALQLADDLNRFLDGRPIAARPVGPLARTWHWCRRKPLLASLAASLVLAVAGGFAGITFNWREAVRQKHEAVRQKQLVIAAQRQTALERDQKEEQRALAVSAAAKAEAMNDFLLKNLLKQADPENNPVSNRVTLLEVLDRAAATVGTAFPGQPETEASIRIAIAETYHGLGEFARCEAHYRAALGLLSREPRVADTSRIKAMAELGDVLLHFNRLDEAGPLLEATAAEARERLGEQDQVTLDAMDYLARYYHARKRCDEAGQLYQNIADTLRRAKGPKHPDTLNALNQLGNFLRDHHKLDSAERLFRECLAANTEARGPRNPAAVTSMFNLAVVLNNEGRLDEAEDIFYGQIWNRRLRSWALGTRKRWAP